MQTKFSRRTIVKGGLTVGAFVPAFAFFAGNANAAGLPPLDVGDPTAKALGFLTDATKVDAASNPTFKAGQKARRPMRLPVAISSPDIVSPLPAGARCGRRSPARKCRVLP
jgi:hypothetical protein